MNVIFAISQHHLCDNNNENFKLLRENNKQKIISNPHLWENPSWPIWHKKCKLFTRFCLVFNFHESSCTFCCSVIGIKNEKNNSRLISPLNIFFLYFALVGVERFIVRSPTNEFIEGFASQVNSTLKLSVFLL